MKLRLPGSFRLINETESFEVIRDNITRDTVFHGTNLWVLFFAILIASLGLNINSTAVVIGAMLISPLMGPILGLGIGVATNNFSLVKVAGKNYSFAVLVGLSASTLYFLLTPLDQAHSELIARVSPNIYDVAIALFGGFAGSLAVASRSKGNVIPGVAIATALMPPLCTAGYGLATWQLNFFFGALYLYIINSVFIGVATRITAYLLRFPAQQFKDASLRKKERGIIWSLISVTFIPSIYFGYDMVSQLNFTEKAESFISAEASFPNNYLLKKTIDPKKREIVLTFGGEEIKQEQIDKMEAKLKYFDLENTSVKVNQGFVLLEDRGDPKLGKEVKELEAKWQMFRSGIDSLNRSKPMAEQVYSELKVMYPDLRKAIIQPAEIQLDTAKSLSGFLVLLYLADKPEQVEKEKLLEFLQIRLDNESVELVVLKEERDEKKE